MSSSHFLPKWKIIQKHFALVHIVKIIRTEVGDVNTSETFSMSEPKPLPEQRECLLDVSDLFPIAVIKQADTSNLGWGGDYHQSKLSSTRSKWQELEADCHSTTTPEQSITSQRCYSANAGALSHTLHLDSPDSLSLENGDAQIAALSTSLSVITTSTPKCACPKVHLLSKP